MLIEVPVVLQVLENLSSVKAIHFYPKIDYYCFSFKDFSEENDVKYENIPNFVRNLES